MNADRKKPYRDIRRLSVFLIPIKYTIFINNTSNKSVLTNQSL